jgi:hypothetical protein
MNAMMTPGTANEMAQAESMDAVMVEVELSEEQAAELETAKVKRQQIIDELGAGLMTMLDQAISSRSEAENRWMSDIRQYEAMPEIIAGTKDSIDSAEYRKTGDNITRSKVLLVTSRLGDMLFPTNEANWDLEPSPSPKMPPGVVKDVDEQGQPLPPEAVKEMTYKAATAAAYAMKTAVKDNLEESSYSAHGRQAIYQAVLYGTGIIKGPYTKAHRKTSWSADGTATKEYVEQLSPSARHVDLWNFYPQPSRSMDECEHVFELHMMPKMKLRRLVKQPGFDKEAINRLLEMEPDLGKLATGLAIDQRGAHTRTDSSNDIFIKGRYAVWEYSGPVPKEALIAFITSMALAGNISPEAVAAIGEALEADNLNVVDTELWMSQGVVIKAMLRPVRDCETLGYYVFNYEVNPDSIFGFGVPFLTRDDQMAVNQVWHAIMLNTMMSAGPQIGVRKGAIEPSQGRTYDLSCTKPRVWVMTDEADDINKALSVFNVPNVVGRMMPVYERIKVNADEHTMMPAVAQGEATAGVPTTGGMAMLMNAANVVMRRLAKQWDDDITLKLIPEFVAWNEQFNDDPAIRGDYNVIAKGASHLLIKDIQAQHIQFATQLFTSNPLLQPYMKPGEWARANIDILELSGKNMLKTDAEVEEQQAAAGEQPNPEVLKSQALQAQAEAAQMRAQAEKDAKESESEWRNNDRLLDHTERMRELDIRDSAMKMQLQAARFGYLHKLASLDSKERVDMAQIAKDLNIAEADQQLLKYEADFKGQLKAQEIVNNEKKLATEVAVESPDVRLQ